MTTYTVGYLVGSLASDSINRTLSKALIRLAPPRLELMLDARADLRRNGIELVAFESSLYE